MDRDQLKASGSALKEVSLGGDAYDDPTEPLVDYDLIHEPIEELPFAEMEEGSMSMLSVVTTGDSAGKNEEGKKEVALSEEEQTLLRSVFVKNVEFSATIDEIKQHFKECGEILRVTIGVNKATRKPLGYCYIEFATQEAAIRSKILNESLFKGRQITVIPKRKNVPYKGSSASRGKHQFRNQGSMMI